MEPKEHMKPQLGDTIINRYTLVSLLRDEPGLQAWKANDRVRARDCQLFIVTDADAALDLTDSLVAALCDRRAGVGGDGLLRVARAGALVEAGVLDALPHAGRPDEVRAARNPVLRWNHV